MSVRADLKRAVVEPAFRGRMPEADGSVPPTVLRNRARRARERLLDALEARGTTTVPPQLETRVSALVAAWAADGFADGFEEAERFEVECAREGEKRSAEGDAERLYEVTLAEHRRRLQEQYGKIELRGLQVGHRVMQPLEEAFVPLRAHETGEGLFAAILEPKPVTDLLSSAQNLLLVGGPGSGKSTLVAWLATRPGEDAAFVVLARRAKGGLDVAEIARQAGVDEAFVRTALGRPGTRVYVDGVDELAEVASFARSLEGFAAEHDAVGLVVTSRPSGCTTLGKFAVANLAPLTSDEVATFIERWCRAAERSVQADRTTADRAAGEAARDLKSRVNASPPVKRLAEVPLLCSVVCLVHRFLGERIPERRVALYEACTNVLLYEWDRAKFSTGSAVGSLDAHQKRRLLSGLALQMHERRVAELPEEEVRRVVARRLPEVGGTREQAVAILAEIRDRSGILVERSPGVFGFSHLSFQEYLAAVELVGAGKAASLAERANDEWWTEVIVLAAGIPGKHVAALIRGLVAIADRTDGIAPRPALLAAGCVAAAVSVPVAVRRTVDRLQDQATVLEDVELGELALALGVVTDGWLVRLLSSERERSRSIGVALFARTGWQLQHLSLVLDLASDASPLVRILVFVAIAQMPLEIRELARKRDARLDSTVKAALQTTSPTPASHTG